LGTLLSTKIKDIRKIQHQPIFPLRYDGAYGPYTPITTLEESIQKNFEYLLITEPGEWPMEPSLGVGLKRYLFEDYESSELKKLHERIESQIERFANDNVRLLSVDYSPMSKDKDNNYIKIVIRYRILGSRPIETTFTVDDIITKIPKTESVKTLERIIESIS
tara:strand:+ start:1668 stop:2156 length:489 start_codon:yes stop_codon:yes gene_type:complete